MKRILAIAMLAGGGLFAVLTGASATDDAPHSAWYTYLHNQFEPLETNAQYHARENAELDAWIAAVNAAPGGTPHKLDFEAKVNFSHSTMIKQTPLNVLFAYVDQIKAAGATRISLNPSVDIWIKNDQATIAKYDAFAKHIRAIGLQIACEPQSVSGDMKYNSFADWKAASLKAEGEMAALFKPDVFILVHEPSSLSNATGMKATVADWTQFVADGVKVIRAASPGSKIGAGVFTPESEYFDSFATVKGLDVLTLDVYDFTALPLFVKEVQTAHEYGKEVFIEESWRFCWRRLAGAENRDELGGVKVTHDVLNQVYEDLDQKVLEAEVVFAEKYGLTGINADRTEPFFTYLPYSIETSNPKAVALVTQAILAGQHTATFEKFRTLSLQYGK